MRAERCREWTAELAAILDDESIRSSWRRGLRALAFGADTSRAAWQLSQSGQADPRRTRNRQWRTGAPQTRPNNTAVRVAVGLGVYLVVVAGVITVLITRPDARGLPFLLVVALAIGFNAFCLTDIARVSGVRNLSKWKWALICLIQCPLGGILYLTVGRMRPARPPLPQKDTRP